MALDPIDIYFETALFFSGEYFGDLVTVIIVQKPLLTDICDIEFLRTITVEYILYFLDDFTAVVLRVGLSKVTEIFLQIRVQLFIFHHIKHRLSYYLEKVEHLEILAHLSVKFVVQ